MRPVLTKVGESRSSFSALFATSGRDLNFLFQEHEREGLGFSRADRGLHQIAALAVEDSYQGTASAVPTSSKTGRGFSR